MDEILNAEFKKIIDKVIDFQRDHRYDEAKEALEKAFYDIVQKNQNNSLLKEYYFWYAYTLELNGENEEALECYKKVENELFYDSDEYSQTKKDISNILFKLGRLEEATFELEIVLDNPKKEELTYIIPIILELYSNINEKKGTPIPEKYRRLIKDVINALDLRIILDEDLISIARIIKQKLEEANRRYFTMKMEIIKFENEEKVEVLKEYIKEEVVGFYKNMAIAMLKGLEN